MKPLSGGRLLWHWSQFFSRAEKWTRTLKGRNYLLLSCHKYLSSFIPLIRRILSENKEAVDNQKNRRQQLQLSSVVWTLFTKVNLRWNAVTSRWRTTQNVYWQTFLVRDQQKHLFLYNSYFTWRLLKNAESETNPWNGLLPQGGCLQSMPPTLITKELWGLWNMSGASGAPEKPPWL